MTTVMKRGGGEQKFVPEKIKRAVGRAAKDAKLSLKERKKLVREVVGPVIRACRKRKTIKATAISKMVAHKLSSKSKETAAAWRKFEKRHHHKKKR